MGLSLKCFHLLSGKQEAKNNIGQLGSMVERDNARSGQFNILQVSAIMVFTILCSLVLIFLFLLIDIPLVKFTRLKYTNREKS